MSNWTKRRTLAAAGAALLTTAGIATYLTLHSATPPRTYPPARTRTTISFTACLVTSPAGIDATVQSRAAWQGLLNAQKSTNIRIQIFHMAGTETVANAQIAVNTLVLRKCNLVTAATPTEAAAVEEQAHLFAGAQFAAITATQPKTPKPANLTIEPPGTDTQVTREITQLTLSAVAQRK
jgi:hypothetical protein